MDVSFTSFLCAKEKEKNGVWGYGVETKRINEAVRNNPDKFPETYMFKLIDSELHDLRSKISSTNVSEIEAGI